MYYTVTFKETEIGMNDEELDINFIADDKYHLIELIQRYVKSYYKDFENELLISSDGLRAILDYRSFRAYSFRPFRGYARFINANDERVFHEVTVGKQIPPVDTTMDVDYFNNTGDE